MSLIKSLISKYEGYLFGILIIGLLTIEKTALADTPTKFDITMSTVGTSSLSNLIQTVTNIVASIGAGVFMIFGMIRTFGIAAGEKVVGISKKTSDGSGDTVIHYVVETMGYIFFSIFIFFALRGLGGVIRGVAETAFGVGVK